MVSIIRNQIYNYTFWIGIYWKLLSCALFAITNVLVRFLSGGSNLNLVQPLPVFAIMFFQSFISSLGLLIFLLFYKTNKPIRLLPRQSSLYFLHFWRIFFATGGIIFWYLSFKSLPVAEVLALSFFAPIFTTFAAVLLLKEKFNWKCISTFVISTVGVYFIYNAHLQFTFAKINLIILLPILATLMFALDKIFVRKLLLTTNSPLTITCVLLMATSIISFIFCLFYGWITPNSQHWPWLMLLAILATGAHFSFSKAYYYAEVTTLLPFSLSKILFGGLASYLAFGEYPQSLAVWLGLVILTSSAIIFKSQSKE